MHWGRLTIVGSTPWRIAPRILKTSPANQTMMNCSESPSAEPLLKFSIIWGENTTTQQAIDIELHSVSDHDAQGSPALTHKYHWWQWCPNWGFETEEPSLTSNRFTEWNLFPSSHKPSSHSVRFSRLWLVTGSTPLFHQRRYIDSYFSSPSPDRSKYNCQCFL